MQDKTNQSQKNLDNKKLSQKRMPLQDIFTQENALGWQVLDLESLLYSGTEVTMDKITSLTSHYMRIIEKLNSRQDPREQYFTFKMQKLMSQPYVIRCFSSQTDNKKSVLQSRRKQLEQTIEKEAERQNHRAIVEQTIEAQKKKQQRLRSTVRNAVLQSNRKLDQRIRKRTLNRLQRSMDQSHLSTSLDNSVEISSGSDSRYRKTITSTDFEMFIDEQTKFRALKRKIKEQEEEQREAMRMQREMGLWKNK